MGFIDFFRLNFALADCNFINIMKTIFFCVHDMVSSNSNSKFESFTNFWPIRNKWIPTLIWFDHKKTYFPILVKLCHENLFCSYLPQPQLRLWSLGSGGIYGSYGAAVTGFPAGIKTDPGWGLYPINLGLLTFEVQNCLKNF